MKKITLFLFLISAAFISSSFKTSAPAAPSLLRTTWIYTDEDKTYEITFNDNNKLSSTNSSDITPDNDFWKQSKDKVQFTFNDKYVTYKGKMETEDLITGTAKNIKKKTWSWKLERKK